MFCKAKTLLPTQIEQWQRAKCQHRFAPRVLKVTAQLDSKAWETTYTKMHPRGDLFCKVQLTDILIGNAMAVIYTRQVLMH